MPSKAFVSAALAILAAACAVGSSEHFGEQAASSDPQHRMPMPGGDTGFDDPPASTSDAGTSSTSSTSSGSSGSSSTSSSSSSGGGSTSSSSSSSTSSSSSSTGGSTSSSSSGGSTGGACGVCDRNWTCNGFTDYWQTQGARCVNLRTTTALECDGKFDQGTSVNVGTWSGNETQLKLVYPMLGGGTKTYVCSP